MPRPKTLLVEKIYSDEEIKGNINPGIPGPTESTLP